MFNDSGLIPPCGPNCEFGSKDAFLKRVYPDLLRWIKKGEIQGYESGLRLQLRRHFNWQDQILVGAEIFMGSLDDAREFILDVLDVWPENNEGPLLVEYYPEEFGDAIINIANNMPYQDYLKSGHWWYARQRKMHKADGHCELCFKTDHLHVHHKTYDHKGCEHENDLIVLCANCHAKFHDKLPKDE